MSRPDERQITVRVSEDLDRWITGKAGSSRRRAAFIRALIDRERASDRHDELLRMFDRAAAELAEEDRDERDRLVGAFAKRA